MWTGLGQGNRLAAGQAACAGGADVIGRGSASDWSTATAAGSNLSAGALANGLTCLRVERAALPTVRFALRTLRFTLRTADLAFTRAETLRPLTLRRTAVFFRATFRRTALFFRATLRCTERRRAAVFAFFLAAMTVLQKFSTPTRASPVATPRLHARLVTSGCQRQREEKLVERKGIEPSTFALRTRRSPS